MVLVVVGVVLRVLLIPVLALWLVHGKVGIVPIGAVGQETLHLIGLSHV